VSWAHYVAQGKGLLDHLKIERAHIMGGCMGCCPVAAFGVTYPQATLSLILFWPVGGAKYRISSHQRFAEHLAFVHQHGLEAVVALVGKDRQAVRHRSAWRPLGLGDQARPRLRGNLREAERRPLQADRRRHGPHPVRTATTAPGAEPEDLMRLDIPALVVPGRDAAHATSAARVSRRMPARRGILGRAGGGTDRGHGAGKGAGVFGESGGAAISRDIAVHPPL